MRLHPAPVPSTESGLSSDMRPVKQECFLSARHPPSLSVLAPQQESAKDQGPSITQDFPNKVSGLCQTIRNQDGCPDHHTVQDDPDEGEDAGTDQGRPSSRPIKYVCCCCCWSKRPSKYSLIHFYKRFLNCKKDTACCVYTEVPVLSCSVLKKTSCSI